MIAHELKHSRSLWLFLTIIILGVTLLCRLGFWQLSRAKFKEEMLEKIQVAQKNPPLSLQEFFVFSASPTLQFYPVSFQGKFINERTIMLDNKIFKGQVGYEIYVPVALNENTLVLVNRGFMKQTQSRKNLPKIEKVMGEATIEGYLDFAYRNPFIVKATETNQVQWPLLMQQLDLSLISRILGKNIYPLIITLHPHSPYALDLSDKSVGLNPQRHLGYAVQWFSLALTLLLLPLFIYFFRVKK